MKSGVQTDTNESKEQTEMEIADESTLADNQLSGSETEVILSIKD